MIKLIETHAHIYASEFTEDLEEVIFNSKSLGIGQILMPNIDVDSIEPMLACEAQYPGYCKPMMGLHPCSVKEDFMSQLGLMRKLLEQRDFVAVGEVGVDLYWDENFREEQIKAFKIQLEWSKDLNLPVVIHSREANDVILEVLNDVQDGSLRGEVHCFSGSVDEGLALIDLGMLLGIGGVVTFKNAGLDKVVSNLPLSALLIETDAPYLSPVPKRGKRNEPSYLGYVVDKLALIYDCSSKKIIETTTDNARRLFDL